MIVVDNVSKRFGGRRPVQALAGVSLEVQAGEVFGLIGPNGSGKTTLMSCLLGFLKPDSGHVRVAGLPPDALEVRRRTGYLPERVGYAPELTGEQFLLLHARLAGLTPSEAREKVTSLATQLGLPTETLRRKLRTYSRGMRQRVGMVQALLSEPTFLFLDEPASGMDPEGVILVRQLILAAKARGATVILNSHQLAEIERVCDRVAFVKAGKVVRVETLRGLQLVPYLVRTNPACVGQALAVLDGLGLRPEARGDGEVVAYVDQSRVGDLAPALVAAEVPVLALYPAGPQLEKLFLEGK
ncbi:MAG: ABC transporter ATP-binding protein [Thermoanaerobaculum sp.]